jgi:hypothetical protein
MNDSELNEILKRATVPERKAEYWEQFPHRVTAELDRHSQTAPIHRRTEASRAWSWPAAFRFLGAKAAFAVGVAAICLLLGFFIGLWGGQRSTSNDPQLAAARKYFNEIEALFPNQVRAIVFDQQGTHLVLAQEPNLPASPPLYLKICGPKGCQRFVTFSGQQIRVNGEVCDVLADGRDDVLVVGRKLFWFGSRAGIKSGQYQIEARALDNHL